MPSQFHGETSRTDYALNSRLIARYLLFKGWQEETLRSGVSRFTAPDSTDGSEIEIFLGKGKSADRDLGFALSTISDYYAIDVASAAGEIRALAYDVISSRIPSEYIRDDTIELRIASEYLEKMKSLLAVAASTELSEGQPFQRLRKEGASFADKCRFGHTFRGSFGLVIESPVGLNDNPALLETLEKVPFARRVIKRIDRGFRSLVSAVLVEDSREIVREANGFSSNMCDAVVELMEGIEVSRFDMSIKYSPEWETKSSIQRAEFHLEHGQISYLKEAAKLLRVDDEPKEAKIVGKVRRLETEGNPADLFDVDANREIEVSHVSDDERIIHVKARLTPADYLQALDAHREGKYVSLVGTLSKTGRVWRLDPIAQFAVLS